ncbi:MAG: cadherin repeat domain-containing protein [Planctomycetaceae bacterium]
MLSASTELDESVAQSTEVVDQYSAAQQEYLAPVQAELQSALEAFLMATATSSSTVGVDDTSSGSLLETYGSALESTADSVATDSQQAFEEAQSTETPTATSGEVATPIESGSSDTTSTSLFDDDADLPSFADTLASSAFGTSGATSGTSGTSGTGATPTTSSSYAIASGTTTTSTGGGSGVSTVGSAVQGDESDELWVFDDAAVGTFVGRVVLTADGLPATSYSIGALNDPASIFTGTFFSVDANGDVTTTASLAPLVGNEGYLVIQATHGTVTEDYSFLVTVIPRLSEPGYLAPAQSLDTFYPSETTPSGTVIGTVSILVGGVIADVYERADASMAYDFQVDTSGNIILTGLLDFETNPLLYLEIRGTDSFTGNYGIILIAVLVGDDPSDNVGTPPPARTYTADSVITSPKPSVV